MKSHSPGVTDEREAWMSPLDELVDQASMDSFPASDPPSFWGIGIRETDRPSLGGSPVEGKNDPSGS
jgi:hypothetical protein